jgi:hypothetical protein
MLAVDQEILKALPCNANTCATNFLAPYFEFNLAGVVDKNAVGLE